MMDRSGMWLLVAVVALVGLVLGYAVFRATPTYVPVTPTTVVTSWPAGSGGIGGRPPTSPRPTPMDVGPPTWHPDRTEAPWPRRTPRATTRPAQTSAAATASPTLPTDTPEPSAAPTAGPPTPATTAGPSTEPTPDLTVETSPHA